MKKSLIANHCRYYRQVRLDELLNPVRVYSIRRQRKKDNPDYQTTFQHPEDGVYQLRFDNESQEFTLRKTIEANREYTREEINRFVMMVDPAIIKWLKDSIEKKFSNYLPAGVAWDGKFSHVEIIKMEKIRNILTPDEGRSTTLSDEFVDNIVREGCKTPKRALSFLYNENKPLRSDLEIPIFSCEKSYILCKTAEGDIIQLEREPTSNRTYLVKVPENAQHVVYVCDKFVYNGDSKYNYVRLEVYKDGCEQTEETLDEEGQSGD